MVGIQMGAGSSHRHISALLAQIIGAGHYSFYTIQAIPFWKQRCYQHVAEGKNNQRQTQDNPEDTVKRKVNNTNKSNDQQVYKQETVSYPGSQMCSLSLLTMLVV